MQMRGPDLIDVLLPPILSLALFVMGWCWTRLVNGGRPLNPTQRKTLWFGILFILGGGYLMVFKFLLDWTDTAMFVSFGIWALVLALAMRLWIMKSRTHRENG